MFATPEKFTAYSKANVESVLTLANTAFAGMERLTALNLNTSRSMLEDSMGNVKSLLAATDPNAAISLPANFVQPMVERMVAYSRSVYEISAQTQQEFTKAFESQVTELNRTVAAMLNTAAKSAPFGSDVAIAAVQSTIAAANAAYDSLSSTARQIADVAEANVAAAGDATLKAVKAGTAAAPKAKSAA